MRPGRRRICSCGAGEESEVGATEGRAACRRAGPRRRRRRRPTRPRSSRPRPRPGRHRGRRARRSRRGQRLRGASCPRARRGSSGRPPRSRPRHVASTLGPVGDAVDEWHLDDLVTGAAREGRRHLRASAGARPRRSTIFWRPCGARGHVECLDECRSRRRRATRWRSGRPLRRDDHGLVLEDRLQDALGDLGLVGRVGRDELRARRRAS